MVTSGELEFMAVDGFNQSYCHTRAQYGNALSQVALERWLTRLLRSLWVGALATISCNAISTTVVINWLRGLWDWASRARSLISCYHIPVVVTGSCSLSVHVVMYSAKRLSEVMGMTARRSRVAIDANQLSRIKNRQWV